jgi:hypothetical protein
VFAVKPRLVSVGWASMNCHPDRSANGVPDERLLCAWWGVGAEWRDLRSVAKPNTLPRRSNRRSLGYARDDNCNNAPRQQTHRPHDLSSRWEAALFRRRSGGTCDSSRNTIPLRGGQIADPSTSLGMTGSMRLTESMRHSQGIVIPTEDFSPFCIVIPTGAEGSAVLPRCDAAHSKTPEQLRA